MKAAGVWRRVLRFNTVGAIGIGVQLAALWILKGLLHVDVMVATALAVETAVVHNFVWHEHWTWRDRTARQNGRFGRLVRFNLSNGLISLVVNLVLMRLLVGHFHSPYLAANLVAIAAGAVANYLASDWFVFAESNGRDRR